MFRASCRPVTSIYFIIPSNGGEHWERLVILSGFRCRPTSLLPFLPSLPLSSENNFRDKKCAHVYTNQVQIGGFNENNDSRIYGSMNISREIR